VIIYYNMPQGMILVESKNATHLASF